MQCEQCGQTSDVFGEQSRWFEVNPDAEAVRERYVCADCGNRQWVR